ncbi:DUF998 domain-containing protein [Sinomonas notoginsengisoli]|uniref:DUF998 domain-containing protein n=1 Tax=Sinomonas notoginsengisoli TaxID=1457311 RepID=UPI001F307BBB|nr:DUF998 domain-containing protein [Sinomonas notoginsengisoli]
MVATMALPVVRPDLSLRRNQISDLLVGDWSKAAIAAFLILAAGVALLGQTCWRLGRRPTSSVLFLYAVATAVAGLTTPTSVNHNVAALTAFLAGPIAVATATWLSRRARIVLTIALIGSFALWPLGIGLGERVTVYGEILFFAFLSATAEHMPAPPQ